MELMQARGVAYVFQPQVSQSDDGRWRASYPGADWSSTGDTAEAALASMGDSMLDRMKTDADEHWQLAAARQYLADGYMSGVYEIPLEVNERIMDSPNPKAALDEVIAQLDAERLQ